MREAETIGSGEVLLRPCSIKRTVPTTVFGSDEIALRTSASAILSLVGLDLIEPTDRKSRYRLTAAGRTKQINRLDIEPLEDWI
jgi:hypothetical protein